jgi:two-component system, OmpR family, phosphate regulon sensor histidine kinase PhoR
MLGGLRGNLIGTVAGAMAALVLTVLLLEDPLVEHRSVMAVRDELTRTIGVVGEALAAGESPDRAAHRVGAAWATHLRIVAPDGRLVGDTGRARDDLEGAPPIPERLLTQALDEGAAFAVGPDPTTGVRAITAVRRLDDGHVVLAARPHAQVDVVRDSMRELFLVGGLMAVAIAALITFVLSRTMVEPMRRLTRAAHELARGNLSVRVGSDRHDELGTLARALDTMADELTERVRTLRAEEARLRTVLDAMVEAVFVTDGEGRIVLTNAALDRLVGGEVQGRTVTRGIPIPALQQAVQAAREGEACTVEVEVPSGQAFRALAAQVAPLPEGAGVVAVLHDVTELKKADRIRRDFVANASHELRTPLTAVRGYTETLRDGALTDPDSAPRFIEMIHKHTLRLQRLVDDLLALSRAEAPEQRFDPRPIDVGRLVHEVVRSMEGHAHDRGLSLVAEVPDGMPQGLGSEAALDEILVNLVDNALKYTPAGGRVWVRAVPSPDRVTVEVSDTGPGIPGEDLDRIFERFYRVDKGRSREVGGTGLGLSIVKHLAQRMGATVGVESPPGEGATFRVGLPRAHGVPRDLGEPVPAPPSL